MVFLLPATKYIPRRRRPQGFLGKAASPRNDIIVHCMAKRVWLLFLVVAALCRAAVPTPAEHLGFTPGDDHKLADFSQIRSYFQKLAEASERIRLVEFGKSSHGKPMYVAFISAAENLKKLDRYREINRLMALGSPDANDG